ncbi:hypothetical protein [Hungatella hathewayi]|uniref:hypothetical protein n=1 Tax=Hungatella hathewayi TaxID=154046 RepID=UPI0035674988
MKISRTLKNQIIEYVKEYANRVNQSKKPVETINAFDTKVAADAVLCALKKKQQFGNEEASTIEDPEFHRYLMKFFYEKLPINYLALKRNIGYYEAKSLLIDKGTDFFPELHGLKNKYYKNKSNDYPATDNQIKYIVSYNVVLNHANELSGREASLIITCLKNPKKTKPAYYNYYIKDLEVNKIKIAT